MKSFIEFLVEEEKTPFQKDITIVGNWYQGYFSKKMSASDQTKIVDAFNSTTEELKTNYGINNSPDMTVYRVFRFKNFSKHLSGKDASTIDDMVDDEESNAAIQRALNKMLDGKKLSLNTGENNIQPWSASEESAKDFYDKKDGTTSGVYVIAKTTVSKNEVIGYYKNYLDYANKVSNPNAAIQMWSRGFAMTEKEVTVDVTLPRTVTVERILIMKNTDMEDYS